MDQHKILDNLSGQEIKEMIKRKEISIEQLDKRALDALFEYESEIAFVGEGDDELLRRCADLLDPVEQTKVAEQKYRDLIRNALEPKIVPNTPVKRKRLRLRKVLIIAATFLILVIGISAIAEAMGFSIFSYFRELIGMSAGSRVETDSITLIRLNESKEYSSIEELLHDQNLSILYPTMLPDGVSIEGINIYDAGSGVESIEFSTGNNNTSITVDMNVGMPPEEYANKEKYCIGKYEYYLFEDGLSCYAVCYHNSAYYTICSTSMDNIILIIENMKEIKK